MKISQEVREFAAKQNSESFLASENLKGETPPAERKSAEEGMEEMAEKYRDGGDLYVPAKD